VKHLHSILRRSGDDEFLERSLQGTSRTFALAIPLLSEVRRREVGLTYLLFRVADSIEDAVDVTADRKIRLLSDFRHMLCVESGGTSEVTPIDSADANSFAGMWPSGSAVEELMGSVPRLVSVYRGLPAPVTAIIRRSLFRTIDGMTVFLGGSEQSERQICLETIADLRLYCYSVAGIVGELLTDLFLLHHASAERMHSELRRLAIGFGEFLQLINILKDSDDDALQGRSFIPAEVTRADVFEIAQQSHAESVRYLQLLDQQGFPADIFAFCEFIFLLAEGSMSVLRSMGAGRKLSRDDVQRILLKVRTAAERRTA
jgi:farnesyl-diphosphate farnesyltransferase